MTIYVNAAAPRDGNGTREMPFKHIGAAAEVAKAGDVLLQVFTGNMWIRKTRAVRTGASFTGARYRWER